jgi:hypothetical protein
MTKEPITNPVNITLAKLKYRPRNRKLLRRAGVDPVEGTWVQPGKSYSSKTMNAGKAVKGSQGTGHRRKAYLGNVKSAENR